MKLEQISFYYPSSPERSILKNLDFNFSSHEYETVGIFGASGIGKSTLALIASGLIRPTTGTVLWNQRKKPALLFQDSYGAFDPFYTLEYSFQELMRVKKMRRTLFEQNLSSFLLKLNLSPRLLAHYPKELSGGELQRLQLIRLFLQAPKAPHLFILDEPTSSLDKKSKEDLWQFLKEAQENEGYSYLVLSHEIDLLKRFCRRLFSLENGCLYPGSVIL